VSRTYRSSNLDLMCLRRELRQNIHMPERPDGKARKRAAVPAAGAAGHAKPGKNADLEARIHALEAERDRLQAELKAAQTRIADLERTREQVVNRIDWVIDSLHSLIEQ
jgi:Tfp pilus assembly protein FimV